MHWIPVFQFCSNSHKKVITKISCHCDLLNSSCSSHLSYKRFLYKIATVPAKYCLNHEQSFLSFLILFTWGGCRQTPHGMRDWINFNNGFRANHKRSKHLLFHKTIKLHKRKKKKRKKKKAKVMFSLRKSQSFKWSSMIYS